ncbi:DNA cytosine methyltransferase [Pararhizobium arenae]|uniref:DNA cytosine methyltransferase n=1 Tax=Pararhizobium arenae TaxID=1856850 RepID=UPI00094AC935|nr:DNA (cytosine-5-)-methyltransferase [Pararhizobium arenae]
MPDIEVENAAHADKDQNVAIPVINNTARLAEIFDIIRNAEEGNQVLLPADVIRDRDIALLALKKKAEAARAKQTKVYLELLGRVRQLRGLVPKKARQLVIMNREWMISRSEALRLLKSSEISEKDAELYLAHHVTPDMIAALARSPARIVEEAQMLIEAGRILYPSDLRGMKMRLNAANPENANLAQSRKLKRAASASVEMRLGEFRQRVARMVRALSLAYMRLDWTRRERREAFLRQTSTEAAKTLLAEFDALFVREMPVVRDWDHLDPSDNLQSLAKVRVCLARLATDEYLLPWVSSSEYGPIELVLIQSLAWLAGVDVDHLPNITEQYLVDLAIAAGKIEDDRIAPHKVVPEPTKLTSLEICSGAGGAAIGLHAAGFASVGLVERDADAIKTLVHNNQIGPVFWGDVRAFDFKEYAGKVDLFAGGVPCQPHSALGNRAGEADERDLFAFSVKIIKIVRPRAVILENVLGFGQRQTAVYRARILAELRRAGYDAEVFAVRAADYGLGQARPRLVLVAMRDGLLSRFKMPPIQTAEPVTLGEALYDLMAANGWPGAAQWADKANRPGPTIVGGSERSGTMAFSSSFQLDEWEALGVDGRAIARSAPSADMPIDHMPSLTLEMGAKLQGFPKAWSFQGPQKAQRRQIANAFPPILACAIGLAVREALTGVSVNYAKELSQEVIEETGRRWTEKSASHDPAWSAAIELQLPLGNAHMESFVESFAGGRFRIEDRAAFKLQNQEFLKRAREAEKGRARQAG